MPADLTPFDRVARYFRGGLLKDSRAALQVYFGRDRRFTGSAFDDLAARSSPDRFTTEDVVAVSMLSVNVPAQATLWLLEEPTANELLRKIPKGATLWENAELLDRDGAAWRLSTAVRAQSKIGPVITSKLLAAKRPHLIPLHDQYVERALDMGTSQWGFWQQVARHPKAGDLVDTVRSTAREAGLPDHVSVLRAIDVAVWSIERHRP